MIPWFIFTLNREMPSTQVSCINKRDKVGIFKVQCAWHFEGM